MYLPPSFSEFDLSALDGLVARDNFITLITVCDAAPVVSHLPVLYARDGEKVELCGHWARPNPQARHAGPALAILHGPHAYVSPAWYTDKEEEARVPTWNYAVAHLHGELSTFGDADSLAELVTALSDQHEAAVGSDWHFEPGRDDHASQLRGIIGFRFHVERIDMKFKLSQNHPIANRVAVAERLDASDRESNHAIAALMRERIPTGTD